MRYLCSLNLHKAVPSRLWNDGYYFSRCRRCGCDMIRAPEGDWVAVPKRYVVVWKPRTADDVTWPARFLVER